MSRFTIAGGNRTGSLTYWVLLGLISGILAGLDQVAVLDGQTPADIYIHSVNFGLLTSYPHRKSAAV